MKAIGTIPTNRAAHATTKIDENEVLMFGGAFVGGRLAKDQLYHLKVIDDTVKWNELNV